MAIKRRGKKGLYWTEFTAPNGQRIRKSTGTTDRKKAEEFERQLNDKLYRFYKLGEKPSPIWDEVVVKWLREKQDKKSLSNDIRVLRWLDQFWRGLAINKIDNERIDDIIDKRRNAGSLRILCKKCNATEKCSKHKDKPDEESKPVSNATINRMLEVIRCILYRCYKKWKLLEKIPIITMLPENNEKIQWAKREEATNLYNALPEHLASMMEFSIETGLRKSNVTHLLWGQVDLNLKLLWKDPQEMKNKSSLCIPLSDRAVEIIRAQQGRHPHYIFTYMKRKWKGHGIHKEFSPQYVPIKECNTRAFRNARKRVNMPDFRWHALRHTFATWHLLEGTPIHALKELGGWKTLEMVLRYGHITTQHLAKFVDKKPLIREKNIDTNLPQEDKREHNES